MGTINLTFKYTQYEYVRAEQQYLIANRTIRKYDPIIAIIFLLFSTCYLFLSASSTFSIVFLAITLIVFMLGCFLYFYVPVLKFKQTSKYHEEYTLKFSRESIEFKTPSIDSVLKWNVYSELWESSDFYFLIQAPRMYTLIPKRAFANPADKQAFEEIALLNMKSAKREL